MPILTPRLRIESFDAPRDLVAAARIYSDPLVMERVAGGPHASVAQTAALLAEYEHQEREHGYTYWAVRLRAGGALLGDCGLYPIEGEGPEVELGFTLAAERWGMGYATEAAGACAELAFETLGLRELRALVVPDHAPSLRVLEKLHFAALRVRCAYGKPHRELSLTAERWTALTAARRG